MRKIAYVVNSGATSGVGRRATAVASHLVSGARDLVALDHWMLDGKERALVHNGASTARVGAWPGIFNSKSVTWVRLGQRFKATADVYHLTNQTLSFLARRFGPTVVTVHDIIELLEPQTKTAYFLNRYLYSGIEKAAHLITVSSYTAQTVRDYYGVPPNRISVIHNGVDTALYPIDDFSGTVAYHELRARLKLTEGQRVVLYVGSDHPRKNVTGAVQAFARAQERVGDLVFVKVGEAGVAAGRAQLLEAIDQLGVRASVRFVRTVSATGLHELYNLADVVLFPSRFEGFGLPPLEAMACGTPVISSNATSLPEVVGGAALTREPDDIDGFATDLERVLADDALAASLRERGLERARQFSWEKAAQQVAAVYQKLAT